MIDQNMLEREQSLPRVALILNQLTSSQSIRAMLVIFSSLTLLTLVLCNRQIPDAVTAILFSVVGYYFGEAAPRPENKTG